VAIALHAALVRAGTDVIFTLDEHGGVHEELGDACESIALLPHKSSTPKGS
jgi:hypothetical protein